MYILLEVCISCPCHITYTIVNDIFHFSEFISQETGIKYCDVYLAFIDMIQVYSAKIIITNLSNGEIVVFEFIYLFTMAFQPNK